MSAPVGSVDRDATRQRMIAQIRDLHGRHGYKWEWRSHLPSFFQACGLAKVSVHIDLKYDFQRCVHRLLPERDYSIALAIERIDPLIDIIRQYHATASMHEEMLKSRLAKDD